MLPKRRDQLEQQALGRLCAVKQSAAHPASPLGPDLVAFFKQSVQKRQTKLGKIAECWGMVIPDTIGDHCALESYSRGVLTVVVDSASHLYELKQLLLAGLQDQLLLACKSAGLRKINLKMGRWYDGDEDSRRPRFRSS
jgi:hypothetical protein